MVRLVLEEEVAALPAGEDGRSVRCLVDLAMPCNMRCAGCDGRRDAIALTDPVAKALSASVLARAEGATSLAVAVYGGEPLLDAARVVTLSTRLRRGCAEQGIAFAAHLITNGTLLADVRPRRLADAGVRTVQVTLDGARRTHDARRRMLDGSGSWRRVVEGLKHVREAASIVVRSPADGLAPVEELLEALDQERLLEGDALAVYVARPAPYADQARDLLKLGALLARA